MKEITISWNDSVTVKLTTLGKDIYERHYRGIRMLLKEFDYRPESVTAELWQIAHVFGEALYNGCNLPFESLEMVLKKAAP